MEKIKNIITGILSVAVFFMAVQVGVAQEKVQVSNDKTEVAELVAANTLAGPVENIDKETVRKKTEYNTFDRIGLSALSEKSLRMDLYWFKVDHTDGAINASPIDPGDLDDELCLSPEDELPICAVAFASASPLTAPPVNNISLTDLEDDDGEETAGVRYQEEE
ncbi:MAG TPA: hypothetical protein VNQ80_09275 [Parapedobacter sp.]|uniref:hypothetical protein n=1 Tax=Parapedobacter sp. TaxID=1958893 RepID=UPI002C68E101|nr:hypothetical protein [Parapedobacter sp.]HWK57517.1 hypothetical protein [Parapedobacter sp.]